ncbi:MAG TPA: hypothetical protein VKB35_12660 [Ktedonobacteraceae bacterium]|nr:hypothetical protein [Ktedonobacteraceae bacterium]
MTKANKPGSQRPGADNRKGSEPKKQPGTGAAGGVTPKTPAGSMGTVQSDANKNNQSSQDRKPVVGGTAVQGAKSTQPREVKAASPQQQQAESYNREMRRRMQHMGMNPTAENPAVTRREKRLKKIRAKKEERREEVKKTVVTKGPSTDIRLGRRNTYFLVVTISIVVLVIIVALIIRLHLF